MSTRIRLASLLASLLLSVATWVAFMKFNGKSPLTDSQIAFLLLLVTASQTFASHIFDAISNREKRHKALEVITQASDLLYNSSTLPVPYDDIMRSIDALLTHRRERNDQIDSILAEHCLAELRTLKEVAITFADVFGVKSFVHCIDMQSARDVTFQSNEATTDRQLDSLLSRFKDSLRTTLKSMISSGNTKLLFLVHFR